jgi:hypothetical protein
MREDCSTDLKKPRRVAVSRDPAPAQWQFGAMPVARFGGGESQPHVVRYPDSVASPKLRFQCGPDLLQIFLARGAGKRHEEALRKCFQPAGDIAGQRRRTRDQGDIIDAEPCSFQARRIITGGRKIPRHARLATYPAPVQGLHQCGSNLMDAAIAAALGNEAASWSE